LTTSLSSYLDQLERMDHDYPLLRMIQPDGSKAFAEDDYDVTLLLSFYKQMLRARMFDRKAINLQRQGRIGTYAPFEGQEAAQIGSASALQQGDWMFPTYRDHAATMTYGHSLETIFRYWKGRIDGCVPPAGLNILPPSVPIATQLLHAVGASWAERLKGQDRVAIAYFGDGATSEGDFHEGLNFGSAFNTPTIFFCQNNHFAISVPIHKQMKSRTIAQKAFAYDIEGIRVDGNDVLAVYKVMEYAVEKARRGDGPTLIEAVTWRYGAHTTADDPTKYRDQSINEERRDEDCLLRLERFLRQEGVFDEQQIEDATHEIAMEIDEAVERFERAEEPNPNDMFDHVFEDLTPSLREQHQQFQKEVTS